MSEYWKSTPKYWCKNCSTYVKDTPFERRQHESTAKHQNNLKRFLRDIQNGHERSEREKQKAKDEVERLNKLTGTTVAQPAATSSAHAIRRPATGSLTAVDQKRQWTQLAEMGIQVPDTYRGELAQASTWSVVSKPKAQAIQEESLSKGVRKRKLEEEEEAEQAIKPPVQRAWGTCTRNYPSEDSTDLDALLSGHIPLKKEESEIKPEGPGLPYNDAVTTSTAASTGASKTADGDASTLHHGYAEAVGTITSEGSAEEATKDNPALLKQESTGSDGQTAISQATAVAVFKKRKNKVNLNNVT